MIVFHSRCVQWMEKAVDKCAQALGCKAFKMVVDFSPGTAAGINASCLFERHQRRSPAKRSATGTLHRAPQRPATIIPRARCAWPGYAAMIVFHSRCVQWMEKAVDNVAQPLRHRGFKNTVKF